MPISFACPTCGRRVKAPDHAIGNAMRCPYCQGIVTVPAESAVSAEEPLAVEPVPVEPVEAADAPSEDRRPCPMCGEMIVATAAKCRYCGEIFDPELKRLEKKRKGKDADSDMSVGDWVVAVLCSGIGCIAGIVWMIQGKKKGLKMFGVSFGFVILWNIVMAIFRAAEAQHAR